MTSDALALAIRAVAETDAPPALAALAQQLRHDHPGDPEADLVARVAEIKQRRVVQAG